MASTLPNFEAGPLPISYIRCVDFPTPPPPPLPPKYQNLEIRGAPVHNPPCYAIKTCLRGVCREEARRALIAAIDSVRPLLFLPMQRRGKKICVLDPNISSFLGLITEVALLREHGVEQ